MILALYIKNLSCNIQNLHDSNQIYSDESSSFHKNTEKAVISVFNI